MQMHDAVKGTVITDLEDVMRSMAGKTGTRIVP